MAAVVRRPADRATAGAAGLRAVRPRGGAAAGARGAHRHPTAALRTGAAAAGGRPYRRRLLGGARELGDPHRRAHRPHRPGLVPQDPRHPGPDHPRRRGLERAAERRRGRHQSQPLRPSGRADAAQAPAGHTGVRAGRTRTLVPAPPVHPGHRAGLVGGGRTRRGALRPRPRPPLVQAQPRRHLPHAVGRLDADGARRAAGVLRGGHGVRALVHGHRAALPGDRPGPASHRCVRPPVVVERRPL